jgi:hypothetical protein
MKRLLVAAAIAAIVFLPGSIVAQTAQSNHTLNHGEVGVYGDLFRVAPSGATATNYLGLGGRVAFNTGAHLALEAEMNYDFEQNYTNVNINNGSGGGSSTTYTAKVRPITGLFGPKFQFGSSGSFRAFLEAKVGFIDFSTSCNAPAGSGSCFSGSLSKFGGSSTHVAAFPGGGIEAFFGPLGIRVDAGDELYWNNGTYNNLRVTFGPTLRF